MPEPRTLTDLQLERVLAGELDALGAEATDADRARLAELRTEHAAYMATVDVDAEVRRIQQRVAHAEPEPKRAAWLRWLAPAGALAAVATVILVLFNRRSPTPATPTDDLQTKGEGVSLVVHLATRDGASQRLATGDTVSPGARIRFEAQGTSSGYVAVVGIDGTGTTTVYYPYNAGAPATLGRDRLLPGAIQLDATPGDENFFALFSTRTFSVDAASAALRAGGALPDGVSSSQVVLHKR